MKSLIAMSGGVDSAVSALLTLKNGEPCIGGMMKLFDPSQSDGEETPDAAWICEKLGIDFRIFDLREAFRKAVIDRFIDDYSNGRTPNPCVYCNQTMKFGLLFDEAEKIGANKLVTGHYARIQKQGDGFVLLKGIDRFKDQSYMLYGLTQDKLARIDFPLGELQKSDTREIAREHGFVNAEKKESQDICFVPDGDYASVIERFRDRKFPEGDFVDEEGNIIGRHRGIIRYTIGQRKGLGITFGKPVYVVNIDAERNRVVLGSKEALFNDRLKADHFNWMDGKPPHGTIKVMAKIRYNQKEQPAVAEATGEGETEVIFEKPQRAITSGQSVVIYDGDVVLGGGIIK